MKTKNEIINEALGEFPQQYTLAKEIANKVINMVKIHDKKLKFIPSINNKFKNVIIDIDYSEDDEEFKNLVDVRPTSAMFNGVNDDTVRIKFFIARNDVLKQNYDNLEQTIYHISAHELNHAYVVLNQAKYNEKGNRELVNPLPEWYDKCIDFLQNYTRNDIAYQFVQSLYACHEKELKAIVSETTPQLEIYLEKVKVKDRNAFVNALENIEPFQRYYEILYKVLPEVDNNKDKLINCLNFWNFNVDEKKFKEICNLIKQKANIALNYVQKNAMLYFHRFVKHDKTDWFKKHPINQ